MQNSTYISRTSFLMGLLGLLASITFGYLFLINNVFFPSVLGYVLISTISAVIFYLTSTKAYKAFKLNLTDFSSKKKLIQNWITILGLAYISYMFTFNSIGLIAYYLLSSTQQEQSATVIQHYDYTSNNGDSKYSLIFKDKSGNRHMLSSYSPNTTKLNPGDHITLGSKSTLLGNIVTSIDDHHANIHIATKYISSI